MSYREDIAKVIQRLDKLEESDKITQNKLEIFDKKIKAYQDPQKKNTIARKKKLTLSTP